MKISLSGNYNLKNLYLISFHLKKKDLDICLHDNPPILWGQENRKKTHTNDVFIEYIQCSADECILVNCACLILFYLIR